MIRLSTSGHIPFPSGSALVFGARKTLGAIWFSRSDQMGHSLLVITAPSSNAAEKLEIRIVGDQAWEGHWACFGGGFLLQGLWLVLSTLFQALPECLIHLLVDHILNIGMPRSVKVVFIRFHRLPALLPFDILNEFSQASFHFYFCLYCLVDLPNSHSDIPVA